MLEQSHTEAILVEFLRQRGREVERRTELKGLTQNSDEAISVLKHGNGNEETLRTRYVIGCGWIT
jgi:2-polyprenyl-6-methoxyphenol hydroxylase-like FAD-dependent oxidoreductase